MRDRVDLAGRERFHRGHVLEPLEVDVDAFFLEPALLDADFPRHPTRPVAVGDFEGATASGGSSRRHRSGGRGWSVRCSRGRRRRFFFRGRLGSLCLATRSGRYERQNRDTDEPNDRVHE